MRETPRRAASGHNPSRHEPKFAAAARMASEVMSGWPELPDCPLHSGAPETFGAGVGGTGVVGADWDGARNGNSFSMICADAGPGTPANAPARQAAAISGLI